MASTRRNSMGRIVLFVVSLLGAPVLRAASPTAFDGYYTGTAFGVTQSVPLSFSVLDGGVNWQAPGPSTGLVGQVDASGTLNATIADSSHSNTVVTLTGALTPNGGGVTGTGTASAQSPPCDQHCISTWIVSRVSGPCSSTSADLCVANSGDDTFDITVHYFTDRNGGVDADGTAISLDCSGVTQGGTFGFSSNSNPELIVKVLNGCTINHFYWVFISAATDQGFTVVVRDTVTGKVATYSNPDHHAATPVQDTAALPCS